MDNRNNIINRMSNSRYKIQNFKSYNRIIHDHYHNNIESRLNTDINTNTFSKYKNITNENYEKNNNRNLLLTRKFNKPNIVERNKIDNNYNLNTYDKGKNNITANGNKRINHTIFVRIATKNQEEKKNNNNINNNDKNIHPVNNNFNNNENNINNNKIQLKAARTPLINIKNYRNSNAQSIPHTKSFQPNNKESKSINHFNNNKEQEKPKINFNYKSSNIAPKTYNRLYNQTKLVKIDLEIKKDDEEQNEEENLMNVINKQIGINNLGNTCFINSSLQILIHCPLFIHNLINKQKLINANTPITSNFLSICDLMLKTTKKYINIYSFKNLIGLKHKLFSGYMQQDSQEFIRILLEDISQELNEIKVGAIYRLLSNSDSKTKKMRDEDFHINFSRREKSIITEIFYAQIVNIYTCQCKSAIYSFQKILDFPLLFPKKVNNNIISLYELLKLYFFTEYIDFESKCNRCNKILKHKKELKISRPPEILILSLQRIDLISEKKLEYKVKFPQKLDIFQFIDKDCGYDKECKYNLFGIINHEGNINSGHYYSFIKNENKEWIEFSDSKVSELNNFSDCSDTVYALFYIKEKYNISRLFKI